MTFAPCRCFKDAECVGMPNRLRKVAPTLIDPKDTFGWSNNPARAAEMAALHAKVEAERGGLDAAVKAEFGPDAEEALCLSMQPVVIRKIVEAAA